jgi:hypothetical protein
MNGDQMGRYSQNVLLDYDDVSKHFFEIQSHFEEYTLGNSELFKSVVR